MSGALEHKVAIVTGAGRGIGAATARLFAREGARVVLASRSQEELDSVVAEIKQAGGEALAVLTDVSNEQQVQALFEKTLETYGPLDILVNNAATVENKPFIEMDLETWEHVMAVNVRGPFLCSRAAFRQMISAGKGGAIVNLSSLSGVRGPEKFPGTSSYVVSKYGVMGLTEVLAVEGKPYGIRVNCVSPGAVDTVMLKKAAPFLKTQTTPDHVARTIFHLADDTQSGHVTGANIEIFSNE
ncbi:MAG TPA: SDR family oxidoreductase [Chloroflexia bacterium]|nr:SDR family oxidoreductase [Chloroflexia bacterium]